MHNDRISVEHVLKKALSTPKDDTSPVGSVPQAGGSAEMLPTSEPLREMLVSKLQEPRLHPALLPRPHLIQRLEGGLFGKLTLISAPAGFGKTTIVRQWIAYQRQRQSQVPIGWLSLDPGDNDPIRFWRYVIMACRPLQTDSGQAALKLLHTRAAFASAPLEPMLRTFLNELTDLPHRGMLILEDYHVINSPEIHEALTFVLDHLPAMLHLIIISRIDPPLPLARWRAHGDLCELHANELRFSQEETATFLQQTLPAVILSPENIRSLDTRLEGWVTGLRLVTLALQGRMTEPETEKYLPAFSGSHRHILEFFVTEVLSAQLEPLQNFLLQTSVLRCLSGPLCNAVTGRNDGEQLLETVERAGLFLQALDGSGQWYRYHPLFAEAMQAQARQRLGEEALYSCYSRASVWYEQKRMLPEAVEMALHAQEFGRVATLLEQHIKPHYEYDEINEYHTLQRWIGSLPEHVLGQHPRLCVQVALLLLFAWGGNPDIQPSTIAEIERLLHSAECAWQAEGKQNPSGELLAIRALVSAEQGDLTRATRFATEALTYLPENDAQWRGGCFKIIGTEAMLAGQAFTARQFLQQARTLFQIAGNRYGERAALLELAEACMFQENLRQAVELYRAVLTTSGEDLFDTGQAQLGLARISYTWNALEDARHHAVQALDLGAQINAESLRVQAALLLATIEQARGETSAAQQRLHELFARLSAGASHQLLLLQRRIEALQARLALRIGDLAKAEHWVKRRTLYQEELPRLDQEQEALITARLFLAQGKAQEALHLLDVWLTEAQQMGRIRSEMELLALLALACFAQQDRPRAFSLLRQALALALVEGELRLFLDEGEPMEILLRTGLSALSMGSALAHMQTLLNAFAQHSLHHEPADTSNWPASSPLNDLLTLQERRVLALLLTGCSNPEIAQMLVVSINTVKTQIRSIYRKLNVKSRKEVHQVLRRQNLL